MNKNLTTRRSSEAISVRWTLARSNPSKTLSRRTCDSSPITLGQAKMIHLSITVRMKTLTIMRVRRTTRRKTCSIWRQVLRKKASRSSIWCPPWWKIRLPLSKRDVISKWLSKNKRAVMVVAQSSDRFMFAVVLSAQRRLILISSIRWH